MEKISSEIYISAKVEYRDKYSYPEDSYYLFSYFITIENHSDEKVKLLSRHWMIFDSNGEYREVQGEGVIGEQPVLLPGQIFTYESACNFKTTIGKMKGSYLFERLRDRKSFEVEIPEFVLAAPVVLN